MPENTDISRRDVVKLAGAAAAATTLQAAPSIQTVHAATDQVKYGIIGVGGRGQYLLHHLSKVDNGRCVAVCDVDSDHAALGVKLAGSKPKIYSDYRNLLGDKDVDAVIISVHLSAHYSVTKDALLAGKHTFCEKSLVFRPEEVHALRALYAQHEKQVLQVGLQRRYSKFYQMAKEIVDKGLLGDVTHVHAQWHRNPGWVMKGDAAKVGKYKANWRMYREFSGGLAAEIASHQTDVADYIFGSSPEFVIGLGGLDHWHDGRDVYDNIQLIYQYSKGRKMTYSAITTNSHLPMLNSSRPEMGECIMGTEGAIEITVGNGESTLPTAMWFREPQTAKVTPASSGPAPKIVAGATYVSGTAQRGFPLAMALEKIPKPTDPFFEREKGFAKQWLASKGVLASDEDRNPVETELESFFRDVHNSGHPLADMEVGLSDSIAVIMSNVAMDENRRVYFSEMDKMGRNPGPEPQPPFFGGAPNYKLRA
ncbi:MAG: oxidoreductase domain protein [Bryobacterales bacterium]|nr:oxidoreductase domain protein [Bryobacterales bacterium]